MAPRPLAVGMPLKPQHFAEAARARRPGLWFEVHAENYMGIGGARAAALDDIGRHAGLSLHGVGLSLAADQDPDPAHLRRLAEAVDRFSPDLVSEHLAWSGFSGSHRPDLMPFPRSRDALDRCARSVDLTQRALKRPILVENPSAYMPIEGHAFDEPEFLAELVAKTGCGLLLDVANLFISASNLGLCPLEWIDAVPAGAIGEIHLAGPSPDPDLGPALLIDAHAEPAPEAVLALYDRLVRRSGPRPVLVERDQNTPSFAELMAERDQIAARTMAVPPMAEAVHG